MQSQKERLHYPDITPSPTLNDVQVSISHMNRRELSPHQSVGKEASSLRDRNHVQQNFMEVGSKCANEFIVSVSLIAAIKQDKGLKGGMIYVGSQFLRAQSIATQPLCLGRTSQRRAHRRGHFFQWLAHMKGTGTLHP